MTLPFAKDGAVEVAEGVPPNNSLQSLLPRSLRARSRFEGFQVRFFDSVALPESILECIIDGEQSKQFIRTLSQWRIDYPPVQQEPVWAEKEKQVFSVAEKILTRGRLTLCSPTLEEEFRSKFLGTDERTKEARLTEELLFNSVQRYDWDYWLDSPAERIFFQDLIPAKFGSTFHRWVLPQVEITSLLTVNSTNTVSGRVDFLICHPNCEPLVVEIDGEEHKSHEDEDAARDAALICEGYRVLRIPSTEIESRQGENLSVLDVLLLPKDEAPVARSPYEKSLSRFIHACKISHQIQLAILQAVQTGFLALADASSWKLTTDLEQIDLFTQSESLLVLRFAIDDILRLLRNLGDLYSIPICVGEPQLTTNSAASSLNISFTGQRAPSSATFFVHNISVPFDIANSGFTAKPAVLDKPSSKVLEYFLNFIFRKPSFWEGQVDALTRTLQGKDSIVLLPTGAGKSITFQLASFLLPGRSIVIEPIISLMDDQIDNLKSAGIDRTIAVTSQITDPHDRARALSLLGQGEYLLAYIAPERFQTASFREALIALTAHAPISLIAVDEAHCISEWGHDFRTAYLNVGRTSRRCCESSGVIPPLLALTGTASRAVLKDVLRELQIEDFEAIITPKSFDRPELEFLIIRSSSAQKSSLLLGYIGQTLPSSFYSPPATFFQTTGKSTYSGLVFCPHINGEFGVVKIAAQIKAALKISTAIYSGTKPKYYPTTGWGLAKQAVARQFKHNQIQLLVCTKAFGMGIDKPNIRFTVHFGIPNSLESFYQEAGRAGRDRKAAKCCILVSDDYPDRTKRLLNPNTKVEDISQAIHDISWDDNDDVTRALYFQTKAFPGIATEKSRMARVLQAFPDISRRQKRAIVFSGFEDGEVEKCLHRLVILGIILDYTINYSAKEFTVQLAGATIKSIIAAYGNYVAGYLEGRRHVEVEKAERLLSLPFDQFVIEMVDLLLNFIYEVVVRGRRRALAEMFAATGPTIDIRQRILSYLGATEFSEGLEKVLAESNAGLDATREAFQSVRSPNEAAELRGQVSRYLESYPDHAGLLMLRALSEIFCRDKDSEIAKQNFLAAVASAEDNYAVTGQPLDEFIIWGVTKISERNISLAQEVQLSALKKYPTRILARGFVKHSPLALAAVPAWLLVTRLAEESQKLTSA